MLPRRIDTPAVQPVARPEAILPADAGQQALRRSLSALLGKQVQADVLARLADGSALVRVAGNQARMALPPSALPGTRVPMTLVSIDPRPTFELPGHDGKRLPAEPWSGEGDGEAGRSLRSAVRAYVAGSAAARMQAVHGAGQDSASPVPGAAEEAAGAPSLSPVARVISGVLAAAQALPRPEASVVASAPLLPAAATAPEPAQLAQRMQQALAHSGLFYESHLAEWAAGSRPLPELAREPQAQRPPGTASTDPDTALTVDRQLSVLEQGRVSWQGEPWPGLPMHWSVQRDVADGSRDETGRDAADGEGDRPAATPWRSELRLHFALLGEVGVTVVLSGDRVHLQVDAGSAGGRDLLRQHAPALEAALGAAGLPLASLGIAQPRSEE